MSFVVPQEPPKGVRSSFECPIGVIGLHNDWLQFPTSNHINDSQIKVSCWFAVRRRTESQVN